MNFLKKHSLNILVFVGINFTLIFSGIPAKAVNLTASSVKNGPMAKLGSDLVALPSYNISKVGQVTSEGDAAIRADVARSLFGVDGSGVTVGVLSDSYNNLGGATQNIATGDLPANVQVLKELSGGGIDEGRAMMQIIHDVAPGAKLAFYSGINGEADFANGIIQLATVAKAKVIVDDIGYPQEPFFQEGIVAQAVDTVVKQGSAYFSAAGNHDRQSYESAFKPSGKQLNLPGFLGGELHNFDQGSGVQVFQSISIPTGNKLRLSFQWDQPFKSVNPSGPGSISDLDFYLLDSTGSKILASSTNNNLVTGDPLEILSFTNNGSFGTNQFNLAIAKVAGPNPGLMKYVNFGDNITINTFDTKSSTVVGHTNAQGAEAVGAVYYGDTPAYGTNPPVLEDLSAAGGTPILFDTAGNRLATPEIRQEPKIVAPDGVINTVPGLAPLFGTSAAASHAAGVAALMLQANPNATPATIYSAMEKTAIGINTNGFNYDSGYGLIQADGAVAAVLTPVPEPSAVVGVLGFGIFLSATAMLKRRAKCPLT